MVFDPVRKQWVSLTPEELVRQLLILHVLEQKICPAGLIAVEKKIVVNERERRYDLALHDQQGDPWLVAECKAPEIPLTQQVLDQIARYNLTLQVPYLLVTNGLQSLCYQIDHGNRQWRQIDHIPSLDEYSNSR